MRIKKKVFFSLMLVFLFSVAVSGGCGGGSSGRYYGNFGQDRNSSHDVTPQNPTSGDQNGDDFGNGNELDDWAVIGDDLSEINLFTKLNNTIWEIEKIEVKTSRFLGGREIDCELVENSRNYNNFTKLKLNTNDSGRMTWTDIDKTTNRETPHSDDFTIQVINPITEIKDTALLIRTATNFQPGVEDNSYQATQGPSFSKDETNPENDQEILWIRFQQNENTSEYVFTQLIIVNDYLLSDDSSYYPTRSYLTLSPATIESVDENVKSEDVKSEDITSFSSLNNTVWKIESMNVQTMQGSETECEIVDNSLNYNDFTKLKLNTDESGLMTWTTIDKITNHEASHVDDLTVQFVNPLAVNPLANESINIAPLIRTATNFNFYPGEDGEDGGYFEATQGPSFTNNTNNTNKKYDIEQVFRTNDNKLGIMNVFYIGEVPFMSYMILAPAN